MAIVVVETPSSRAAPLGEALCAEGFQVRVAAHVDDVRAAQLVLLAAPRADADMLSAIAALRLRHADANVVVATESDDLDERLACYAAGADDCLSRPFHMAELAAKLRALQRRRTGDVTFPLLAGGDALVDCGALELRVAERSQSLTKREAELLRLLARAEGGTVDRGQVLREAWGAPRWMSNNSVDVYVGYVRRKLDLLDADVTVKTVRGAGFQVTRREPGASPADRERQPVEPRRVGRA